MRSLVERGDFRHLGVAGSLSPAESRLAEIVLNPNYGSRLRVNSRYGFSRELDFPWFLFK